MKRFSIPILTIFFFLAMVSAQDSQVDLGISVSDGKLRSFYLAIGDYYRVPGNEIVSTREKYRLSNEELPVIYFLAARARVAPSVIIDLRMGGMSWLDVTFHYGLTPEVYFVPVTAKRVGPPYGNAYGYYNKYGPTKEWKKIVLKDHEIIDLVNLRFMSEHYGLAPEAVMKMRGQGKDFISINEEGKKGKANKKGESGKGKKDSKGKGKTKHKL